MEVTLLGTGAPMHPTRCATGMLVDAPGAPLLIDTCGGFELPRQMARIGRALGEVRDVILTHQHMDHIGGVAALYIASIPLTFHALPETHAGVREFMHGCFPELLAPAAPGFALRPEVQDAAIAPGERYTIGGFAVTFFATAHRVPTVAVRVEAGGKVLAFSADGVPGEDMVACARDADLFLCDALCAAADGEQWASRARSLMHPTAREAAEMAVAANAKSLALTHLARYATPEKMLAEAHEVFSGPVSVPDDCATLAV